MNPLLAVVLALAVLAGIPVGYVFYETAFSPEAWTYLGDGQWAAPGPVAGAGLPVFLIAVGVFGVYWVVRLLRQNTKQSVK